MRPPAKPAGVGGAGAARRMVREIIEPENVGHRARVRRRERGAPLALVLLFAAGGCNATVTSTDGATPNVAAASSPSGGSTETSTTTSSATPSPRPAPPAASTRRPFLWALLADGQSGFIEVSGAPPGSVCTVRAFLKSGREISGTGLKPKLVTGTGPPRGVSWSDKDAPMLRLPSPAPSPGEDAYWLATCINSAFSPPRGTTRSAFQTP
jgi:hypothetical protein